MPGWASLITFDPTISLGSIITAVAMLIGGIGFVWAMRGDIKLLAASLDFQSKRLEKVENSMNKVTEILVDVAAQGARLDGHDKLLDDLRRGEGYILPIKKGSREIG